jgi:hypothetical protein
VALDRVVRLIAPNAFASYCVQNRTSLKGEGKNEKGEAVLLSITEPHQSNCVNSWASREIGMRKVVLHIGSVNQELERFFVTSPTNTMIRVSANATGECL